MLHLELPRYVFIQLLEHCNLRCRMCYEWGDDGSYHEKPSLKRLEINVVERIIEECSAARPYYELYGGEPLLYSHIERVLRALQVAGSKVSLPTNGSLLEKKAAMLVDTAPERLWVSLDGPPEINDQQRGHGVFEQAMKGLEKLYAEKQRRKSLYPQIGVSVAVTPLNYRYLGKFFFEVLDLCKIDCFNMELQSYITPTDHQQYEGVLRREFGVESAPVARGFVTDPRLLAAVDAASLAHQVRKIAESCAERGIYLNTNPKDMSENNIRAHFAANWSAITRVRSRCVFPWISTEISARGDVTTCHAFYDLSMGNVHEQSLGEIWRGTRYAKFRNYLRRNLLPICQACTLLDNTRPPEIRAH